MSTRSSIAVVHADGSVSAVYCHFDGYTEGVGAALLAHHNSQSAAEALVALGDLSCVQRCGNVEAYSRDRGEPFEDVKPKRFASVADYRQNVRKQIADNGYQYMFHDGAWWTWGYDDKIERHPPQTVADALAEIAAEKTGGGK